MKEKNTSVAEKVYRSMLTRQNICFTLFYLTSWLPPILHRCWMSSRFLKDWRVENTFISNYSRSLSLIHRRTTELIFLTQILTLILEGKMQLVKWFIGFLRAKSNLLFLHHKNVINSLRKLQVSWKHEASALWQIFCPAWMIYCFLIQFNQEKYVIYM